MTLTIDTDRTEEVVESIVENEPGLRDLARRHFDEPRELCALAQWFDQDEGASMIASLKRLCEERSDLHLARAQHSAVLLLLEIARGAEDTTDLARKACNDLLRAPRHGSSHRRERPGGIKKPESEDVASLHDVVRSLMGRLGRDEDQAPAPVSADNGASLGPRR